MSSFIPSLARIAGPRIYQAGRAAIRLALTILLCLAVPLAPVRAADVADGLTLSKDLKAKQPGTEFVSGESSTTIMMKVNLWGAVNRPGIHHVPVDTDLATLLSYAGGPTEAAELDKILIKRQGKDRMSLLEVDLDDMIQGNSSVITPLEANDIVVIPASRPLISQNTVTAVGVISTVLSIVLVGFLVSEKVNNK